MVEYLTEKEEQEYREKFNAFDRNGDNTIDKRELGEVMQTLGLNPTEGELQDMIHEVDLD